MSEARRAVFGLLLGACLGALIGLLARRPVPSPRRPDAVPTERASWDDGSKS